MLLPHFTVAFLLAVLTALLGPAITSRQAATAERLPIPTQSQQTPVLQTLRDTYKAKLAESSDEGKLQLAEELRQAASELDKDLIGRFVYLNEARRLSLEATELGAALEAIAELEREFLIDTTALQVEAVAKVASDAEPAEADAAAVQVLDLVESLLSPSDLKSADRILKAGSSLVAKAPDARVQSRWVATGWHVSERQRVEQARQKLQSDPNDPRSLETLGRHECLLENNFVQGLPRLGAVPRDRWRDKDLRRLAEDELREPTEPNQQLELGNQWLEYAKSLEPMERKGASLRAVYWYEKALPAFAGTAKGNFATKRIEEARAMDVSIPVEPRKDAAPAVASAPTKPAKPTIITRVSLDIHRSKGVAIVYYSQNAQRQEVEYAQSHIANKDGKAAREYADIWRDEVKLNLPDNCKLDRRVTINVNRPWHPADHGDRGRCSWSCQYEGKGAGDLDKVCRTGDT